MFAARRSLLQSYPGWRGTAFQPRCRRRDHQIPQGETLPGDVGFSLSLSIFRSSAPQKCSPARVPGSGGAPSTHQTALRSALGLNDGDARVVRGWTRPGIRRPKPGSAAPLPSVSDGLPPDSNPVFRPFIFLVEGRGDFWYAYAEVERSGVAALVSCQIFYDS